jgi:hypothetical protein
LKNLKNSLLLLEVFCLKRYSSLSWFKAKSKALFQTEALSRESIDGSKCFGSLFLTIAKAIYTPSSFLLQESFTTEKNECSYTLPFIP